MELMPTRSLERFWKAFMVARMSVAIVLVVVRLWLFALLPWPGVGAFAGSA